MHMADTLLSPAVGGAMWALTAGVTAYSAKKVKDEFDDRKVPVMGVLGAFIFAAQMINFSIPGTGSSGHLGGGMLLAILLGPYAGFLTIASVLVVQSLFFADGGLLALGCNIFNLGFWPCFVAYPLIFKIFPGKDNGKNPGNVLAARKIIPGAMLASIVGLQLGAFGVVMETVLSGITELPFSRFVMLMQPIHLAIGVIEGIVTAGIVLYIVKAKPEILERALVAGIRSRAPGRAAGGRPASSHPDVNRPIADRPGADRSVPDRLRPRNVLIVLGALAVLTGGIFSWFASAHPDGLEWSIFRATGKEEFRFAGSRLHSFSAKIQEKTAFLPDYDFKRGSAVPAEEAPAEESAAATGSPTESPSLSPTRSPGPAAPGHTIAVDAGTTLSGLVGALLTLSLAGLVGFFILKRVSGGRSRRVAP